MNVLVEGKRAWKVFRRGGRSELEMRQVASFPEIERKLNVE